jgi:iron(III) transport system ATP-binding protein
MISIDKLSVWYRSDAGHVHAVQGIDIEINKGEFYTLLGPSGCGKTTTLRALAGLELPEGGEIRIADQVVYSGTTNANIPPYERDIGMVFQSYAIWPHMNVFENVAFPLRELPKKMPEKEVRELVLRALDLVQLHGLEKRAAPYLSGGQQQRLALARAIVNGPRVMLLDEPLSNLDAKLRDETRRELRVLVKRLGITTVFVTHDQLEALTMSDRVAVMNQGIIVQEGTPLEIYNAPSNRFVAEFIGTANFLEGKVDTVNAGEGVGTVTCGEGKLSCRLPEGVQPGEKVSVVVRPEDIELRGKESELEPGKNVMPARVDDLVFIGESFDCTLSAWGQKLRFRAHPTKGLRVDDVVNILLPPSRCRAVLGHSEAVKKAAAAKHLAS